MGKPTICICENKGADQLRSNCEADQHLCFHYTDSTVPLLLKIQNFKLLALFCDLHRPVCVGTIPKQHCWFSHEEVHFCLSYSFLFLFLPSYYLKRRKRHLQPTIVITEPPKLAQTYAYIPKSNCAVVKHKTVINPPVTNPQWTWSNNILGTSVYCCQSLFRAFTRCWTDTSKAKACQSKTNPNQVLSNHDQVLFI